MESNDEGDIPANLHEMEDLEVEDQVNGELEDEVADDDDKSQPKSEEEEDDEEVPEGVYDSSQIHPRFWMYGRPFSNAWQICRGSYQNPQNSRAESRQENCGGKSLHLSQSQRIIKSINTGSSVFRQVGWLQRK